jgi:hypothetical protein
MSPKQFLTEAERAILEQKYPELESQRGQAYAVAVAKVVGYLDRSSAPLPAGRRCGKD